MICKCGHSNEAHFYNIGGTKFSSYCHMTKEGKIHNYTGLDEYADNCMKFEFDNLRYLEDLAGKES